MARKRQFIGSDEVALAILEAAKVEAGIILEAEYGNGARLCESPIEKIFLAQFLHPDTGNEFDMRAQVLCPPSGLIAHVEPPPIPGLYIWPQITIGDYRVDFVIGSYDHAGIRKLIVECDGHDFHEKTKWQATRDKARDRYLVSQGYRMLRFTGSEIFKDPVGSVMEAVAILLELK